MASGEIDPGLLALADQVYAALLDEWSDFDERPPDASAFTAEFEVRLLDALEALGEAWPDVREGDDDSSG